MDDHLSSQSDSPPLLLLHRSFEDLVGENQNSDQTWPHLVHLPLPESQHSPPSPPAPIPIPSPALPARGLADLLDVDAGINPQADLESGPERRSMRRPSFVEGLITGLKRLPRALTKSYHPNERKTDRANDSVLLSSSLDDPSSPPRPSAAQVPLLDNANNAPGPSSEHEITPAPSHSSLTVTPTMPIPFFVEPKPTSDYAKMDPPFAPAPDPSISSYITRLYQFIKAVNDLPWIAPRSTVDYIPGQFSTSPPRHPRRETLLSWYAAPPAPRHHSLDLLSSGSPGEQELTRLGPLPGSSATLVYQPDLGMTPFHKSHSYQLPTAGKHARSRSVQFTMPTSSPSSPHPYPIMCPPPPPARTP